MTSAAEPTPAAPRVGFARVRPRTAAFVAIIAGALVLALRLWLKWVGPIPGDEWALHNVKVTTLPTELTDVGVFFSVIGTPVVASISVLCALPFVLRTDGLRGAAFVLLSGTGVFFNMVLKVISGPTPLMAQRDINGEGLNYPSGHTVYGVVFFGSLAWLAWRHRRFDVAAPLLLLLLAMGPFRVVAETHFVSDVIAGYLVGLAWLILAATVTGVRPPRIRPANEPDPDPASQA